jgi:hypothetical protein
MPGLLYARQAISTAELACHGARTLSTQHSTQHSIFIIRGIRRHGQEDVPAGDQELQIAGRHCRESKLAIYSRALTQASKLQPHGLTSRGMEQLVHLKLSQDVRNAFIKTCSSKPEIHATADCYSSKARRWCRVSWPLTKNHLMQSQR